MKIGFLLLRDTFLKTMGSLIQASLDRDHQVLLLYTQGPARGSKSYQQVTDEKLSVFTQQGAEAVSFSLENLGEVKEKFQLDALATHEGYYMLHGFMKQVQQARKSGVKVVTLPHFYENAMRLPESLDYFDKTYYLSQFAMDTHFGIYGEGETESQKSEYRGRCEVTGSPMFDQMKHVDREQVRKELSVPGGQRVVVFFAPAVSAETRWRWRVWGSGSRIKRVLRLIRAGGWKDLPDVAMMPTLEEMATELRAFCDRNNAFLIIKSRAKQNDAKFFEDKADLYLSGEKDTYFPVFTSYRLLAIADLCVGVMSMSILEAAAMRVPVWNIYVPSEELSYPPNPLYPRQKEFYQVVMGREKEGPFSFPGVITNINPRQILKWLRANKLDDLTMDPESSAAYAEKYLGITDESSSERILGSLELLTQSDTVKA
jgi:hypothetical protein